MARKVWILALKDEHKGQKEDAIDVLVVTDDNTAGTEAAALADAAYPHHVGMWSTTLAAEQDGAVTPAADGIWIVGKMMGAVPGAIAT